eukprot:1145078-Pelagomonas_calceolata.AAC.2
MPQYITKRKPPDPGSNQGIHKKHADGVCVVWNLCSLNHARCTPGHPNLAAPVTNAWQARQVSGWMVGWLAQAPNCLQTRRKRSYSTSHCLLRPPDAAGLSISFVWEVSQSFKRGVRWVSQGCRCQLYQETGKPRGLRSMTGASPNALRS